MGGGGPQPSLAGDGPGGQQDRDDRDDRLYRIRHSAAHLMAEAVVEKFPHVKLAIGPPIEDGFYYDFDLPRTLTGEDLADIEKRMRRISKGAHRFDRTVISRAEAERRFADQPYKLEIIADLPADEEISLYTQDTFTDLCRGPHVENTNELQPAAIKLTSVAGAYWRGDEKRAMLQRIYGTAWESKEELDAHLDRLAEIEKRDHRRLGKELGLFSIQEQVGAGLVFWHPKGARIRSIAEDFWKKEHYANGYDLLNTPHVGKEWLWKTSGHLDFYAENMWPSLELDNATYYLKPMNCPFHIMIYKSSIRSYRELPLRWAELGTVYRYERSGVLHGALRVRGMTQDDAHIFCTPDQVETEIEEVLRFSTSIWKAFGFHDLKAFVATKPAKAVGDDASWEQSTASLRRAVDSQGLDYEMDEGGGAFYGPKIDMHVRDPMGRLWQMTTIQFDFNLPERFDMKFVDQDGKEKRPFMVHRALYGTFERFLAVLIEHYGGAFPMWLAPVQATVLAVRSEVDAYARRVAETLKKAGFRVDVDVSDNRIGAKIRNAQGQKVPFMIIVGEKEEEAQQVSLRDLGGGQHNGLTMSACIDLFTERVDARN
jgi:threonyl-tRNA synthetase